MNYYHALGNFIEVTGDLSEALADCGLGDVFEDETESFAEAAIAAYFGLEEARFVYEMFWTWDDLTNDCTDLVMYWDAQDYYDAGVATGNAIYVTMNALLGMTNQPQQGLSNKILLSFSN